jgi:hypothetical protein
MDENLSSKPVWKWYRKLKRKWFAPWLLMKNWV